MSEITPPEINPIKKRTLTQNKAIHLWFTMMANELNNAGLDMRKVLKPGVSIPWTPESFKENIFKPVLKIYKNKNSTTEMTTKEIDELLEIIVRHLGETQGFESPEFPSIESLMSKQQGWKKKL